MFQKPLKVRLTSIKVTQSQTDAQINFSSCCGGVTANVGIPNSQFLIYHYFSKIRGIKLDIKVDIFNPALSIAGVKMSWLLFRGLWSRDLLVKTIYSLRKQPSHIERIRKKKEQSETNSILHILHHQEIIEIRLYFY